MQEEPKVTPLETLLIQLKEKMSADFLFDSSIVLTVIKLFETEKIALKELLSIEKVSIGGIIDQLAQFISKNKSQNMSLKMHKALIGQSN